MMPPQPREKGLVGILSNEAARYAEFWACVSKLDLPYGWEFHILIGGDWCGARNTLCEMTLEGDYSHLWYMDDDHSFAPDLLRRLLTWRVPLVTPICLTRTFPFLPVTYTDENPGSGERYLPLRFEGRPGEGLVEALAGGTAGMLIERQVIEAIEPPWFEHTERSEDIVFCEKAMEAGYVLHTDLGARLAHITTASVFPHYDPEQGWTTGMFIGRGLQITVPIYSELISEDSDPRTRSEGEPEGQTSSPSEDPETSAGSTGRYVPGASPSASPGEESPSPSEPSGEPPSATPSFGGGEPVFERAELWYDQRDFRWYARLLDHDGLIRLKLDLGINEQDAVAALERDFTDLPIFYIRDELDDSRHIRKGPPLRLWDRQARQ
jgi:hypothetical protein